MTQTILDGIKTVIENLEVKNIIVSMQKERYQNFEEIMEIAKRKRVNVIVVKRGDRILFDKSSFVDIIYPTQPLPHEDINNNSIVAKFICQGKCILFTRRY